MFEANPLNCSFEGSAYSKDLLIRRTYFFKGSAYQVRRGWKVICPTQPGRSDADAPSHRGKMWLPNGSERVWCITLSALSQTGEKLRRYGADGRQPIPALTSEFARAKSRPDGAGPGPPGMTKEAKVDHPKGIPKVLSGLVNRGPFP